MKTIDAFRRNRNNEDYIMYMRIETDPLHYQLELYVGIPQKRKYTKVYKTHDGIRRAYHRMMHQENPERYMKSLIK